MKLSRATTKKLAYVVSALLLVFLFSNKFSNNKNATVLQPTLTPRNAQTIEAVPTNDQLFTVKRVIDGDTIELESGETVRYIGMDTPETVKPNTPIQCFGKEASAKNKELVEGRKVKLVKDVSETDRFGRLLRYVYIDDIFVNDYLVREGYANAASFPPDVKFQDQFTAAESEARNAGKGLWNSCNFQPTPTSSPTPITTVVPTPTAPADGTYNCNCSKSCASMSSCEEAQFQLNICGCKARDGNEDGVACDGEPLKCNK